SFTDTTVRRKVSTAEAPFVSVTVMVTVAVPNELVAGRRVKVRLVPVPVTARLFVGTSVGDDELALTTRSEIWWSTSPMVNVRVRSPSSGMLWSGTSARVGGSFTGRT